MKVFYSVLILCFFGLVSCKTTSISSDYDQTVNFNNFKTFNFSNLSNKLPVDDIVKNRIFDAIERNLVAKGFRKSDTPDFLVDLGLQLDKKKKHNNSYINLDGYFGKKRRIRAGVGKSFNKVKEYTEGTLVLNILDMMSNSENVIWKGHISGVVKPETSSQQNISSAINQVLAGFPPN